MTWRISFNKSKQLYIDINFFMWLYVKIKKLINLRELYKNFIIKKIIINKYLFSLNIHKKIFIHI